MTLFNDSSWTDKKSPLWFIMLPTGHEGPYSLDELEKRLNEKKLKQDVLVWREGLPVPISLKDVLTELETPAEEIEEELPPPLPPLPIEEEEQVPAFNHEELPEIPLMDSYDESVKAKKPLPVALMVSGAVVLLVMFGLYQWMKDKEVFEIRRYPKMSLELHKQIQSDLRFEGFNKKIFFREYASPDLTHLWLVTTGFQRCDVEAVFRSVPDRLLTMGNEEVEFVTRGKLAQHVTEFNVFDFRKGSRIIPGLYEMDVKATRCEWDGIVPRIRNFFVSPEGEYVANTRVVLYPRGPDEFQEVLSKLMKQKEQLKKEAESQEQLFWEDLQMKFQTLHAISLQIEQHFLDFLDQGNRDFPLRLKQMTSQYTKKFGDALTKFVVENEGYFDGLRESELRELITRKDYEGMVRTASKNVGLESMKIIEKLQGMKKPSADELKKFRAEVLQSFEKLKNDLTNQLLRITEDRTNSQ